MDSQHIEAFVDAAADAVGMTIAPAHRPGVLAYFALAEGLAQQVFGMPLVVADDPAEAFTPVSPDELG